MELYNNYFYDSNLVRYQLVQTNPGNVINNWLFMPGGPGADSRYFISLIKNLDAPGNFWLIDLPGNGTNVSDQVPMDYNFDHWCEIFVSIMQKFANTIYVGHSFGGMFPLLFPQLETLLKGLVILNSAPCLWLEEAAVFAKKNHLPLLEKPMQEFQDNPNPATFKAALLACAPYYFTTSILEVGKQLLEQLPFNYLAAVWWLKKAQEINFSAKWVPEKVPTLIISASHDFIVPYTLFERDQRFQKENIIMHKIENAGHFPWLEQTDLVKAAFKTFAAQFRS